MSSVHIQRMDMVVAEEKQAENILCIHFALNMCLCIDITDSSFIQQVVGILLVLFFSRVFLNRFSIQHIPTHVYRNMHKHTHTTITTTMHTASKCRKRKSSANSHHLYTYCFACVCTKQIIIYVYYFTNILSTDRIIWKFAMFGSIIAAAAALSFSIPFSLLSLARNVVVVARECI